MPIKRRTVQHTSDDLAPPTQKEEDDTSGSSARERTPDHAIFNVKCPQYKFENVILHPKTYNNIQNVLAIQTQKKLIFEQWGFMGTHPYEQKACINLYGASGTGKSMAAHAIASQLQRNILVVDYSQIESRYVGDTAKNLVSLFQYAKKENAIIFFDEADALLSKRVESMSSSTDVSVNQTRSTLLLLLNDFNDIIIFATNFIKNYDSAFMRRMLGHIKFELPDEDCRKRLWAQYIPAKLPLCSDKESLIGSLSKKFDNISGADISNAILQAALEAARQGEPYVSYDHIANAIENINKSKTAHLADEETIISQRKVSKEFVDEQLRRK